MHKNIKTVAGCFTNVTCNVSATDGREVELTAYIAIGQERRPVPKAGAKLFAFPAVEYGQHLYEIRADGKPLIFGFLLVRPSAFPVAQGTVDYTLNATLDSVDALHVDIELTPGPRGYSAYEVAVMEGFVGSEAEWLEHMRQQTATMAVERVTPLMERAETAADKSEREAAAAKTGQETAAAHAKAAKASADAAAEHKTAAAGEVTKAAAEVEKAKLERETAAEHATAAAKSAQDAETAKAGAEQAARDAQTAKNGAEQAAANADASKSEAQTAEGNAKASADAAAADKAAAEKAKTDAQTSQTAAAQSAAAAQSSASILAAEVVSLPVDYMRFSEVESLDELSELSADLQNTTVWRYPLPKLKNFSGRTFDSIFPNVNKILIQNESGERFDVPNPYFLSKRIESLFIMLPNAAYVGYISGNVTSTGRVDKLCCFAPKATGISGYAFAYFYTTEIWLLTAATVISNWTFMESSTKIIWYIGDKIKTFNHPNFAYLREVHCGFPVAELLNFQKAKLDKPSVLRIVNSLQPYNAETMGNIPALTLGIDPTLDGDAEINAALLNAQTSVEDGGKGWSVAVNGFTITAGGVATMALRKPIYARLTRNDEGEYIDNEGDRWSVRYGNTVIANWVANEQLGYEEFATLEDALELWGLREYQPEESKSDL